MTDDNDARVRQTAHGLIQGYIGPDHVGVPMLGACATMDRMNFVFWVVTWVTVFFFLLAGADAIMGQVRPDLKVIDMIERLYSVEHLHDRSTRSHRVS